MMRSVLPLLPLLCLTSVSIQAATFPVADYGAKADGSTDNTSAFQKALDAARAAGGGTVFAPAGRYLFEGTLRVPPGVNLEGEFSGTLSQHGTTFLVKAGKGEADGEPFLHLVGGSSFLRGVTFEYPEQTADATEAVAFPFTVRVGAYTLIENVHLYNAYQGLEMDGAHAAIVRNLWGEPLRLGINADHIHDICRIENVHFWPFFTINKPLRKWVQENAVAFQFGRSDWQYCFNTFVYGYHTGYRFYASEDVPGTPLKGGTTNGNYVGIGADSCVIGIDVERGFSIGISVTNGLFAPFGTDRGRAVLLREGNTGNLTLTNCNFWAVPDVLFEVRDGSLSLSGCNIEEWAVTHPGQPCFLAAGGRLTVTGCTFNRGDRLLARLEGSDTRATFTGNMGTGEGLRVENGIGDRAVVGLNNPALEVATGSGD